VRILAPISRTNEVEILSRCGADEFYTGIMPRDWIEKFSPLVWTNRRGPFTANFSQTSDLKEAVRIAHDLGKEVFIAFNAPYYTSTQLEIILPLAHDLIDEVEPDGLIISDVGLIRGIQETGVEKLIVVSTLAAAQNVESIRFFQEMGAKRVILPRQLSLSEIENIRARVKDLQLEAFIMNDTCVFQEGHCHTQHNVPDMESFCYTPWEYTTLSNKDLCSVSNKIEKKWRDHIEDYREWLWFCKNCGYSMTLHGLTNSACGLCAIFRLHKAGIDVLKIVGREASLDRKAKSVILVRKILNQVLSGATEEEATREARGIRATPEFCNSGYMCYYRDANSGKQTSAGEPEFSRPGRRK
jgi:putative protease